jgi:hypothetical protein
MSQQLLTAPGAPNSVNAEPQGKDMLIGWTASRFDGGARILDYSVFVDGALVCTEEDPTACTFPDWAWSKTYTVAVSARNEIGSSRLTTVSLTTPDDPNPNTGGYQYPGPILAKFTPSTAATGQVVTVTGNRLSLIERMEIGGKPTDFVIYSSEKLSFKVPYGLADGRYDVVVYSEFGKLTVQDALRIAGAPVNEDLTDKPVDETDPARPGDTDGDGIPNDLDGDIDGDGQTNGTDQDIDNDNIPNEYDPDPVNPSDPSDAMDQPRPAPGEEAEFEIAPGITLTNALAILGLLISLSLGSAVAGQVVLRRSRLKSK